MFLECISYIRLYSQEKHKGYLFILITSKACKYMCVYMYVFLYIYKKRNNKIVI